VKNIKVTRNPYLIFLPFLLFYIVFVLILYSKTLWGDEIRHLDYAQNLFHGFYSPPPPNVKLDIGPGYPILMLPFIVFHIPLIGVSLVNAVLGYLAIIFLFKTLQQFVSFRIALIVSLFLGCYFNSLEFMALMYSESLTLFLVSCTVFLLLKAFNPDHLKMQKYVYLSGIIIGYLALTKIIFGYVLLCMLIGCALLWLINRKTVNYKKSVLILLIALATTAPYLIYTYHLTGKLFYWGTSGGNNLYWMSSPYKGEFGNWVADPKPESDSTFFIEKIHIPQNGGQANLKNRNNYIPGGEDSLDVHHQKDFLAIANDSGIARDDAFKKFVIKNIKSHPAKYIENCFSNIGRILFNYPYSYTIQKPETLLRLPLNGIILVFALFCVVPTFINWRNLLFPIRFMLFFTLLYLGGSVFGSAETRMFTVIVPVFLFWITYICQKSMKVKLKFNQDSKQKQ
jgi:hypothetical protein